MNHSTWKKLGIMALALCLLFCVCMSAAADEKTEGDFTFSIPYGNYATVTAYNGEGGEIAVPEYVDGVPVAGISSSAFSAVKDKVTDVTVPGTMERISSAFKGCVNLTNVTLMNGLTTIGADAFNGCSSLTEISIPDSVAVIGANAFTGCSSLADVTIPAGVTAIGANAFSGCDALASITLPAGLEKVTGNDWSTLPSLSAIVFKGTEAQWAVISAQLTLPVGLDVYCTDTATKAVAAAPQAEAVPAANVGEHEHVWTVGEDSATCNLPGKAVSTCSVCGMTKIQTTPALGHQLEPQFLESHGYVSLICTRCGLKVSEEKINGLHWPIQEGDAPTPCDYRGYHIARWRARTATCGVAGMSDRVVCATCDAELVPGYELTARTHWWGEWNVLFPGNCVCSGVKVRVCRTCHEEQFKETGLNFNFHGAVKIVGQKAPTCIAKGYTGDVYCTRCGMLLQRGVLLVIDPKTHEDKDSVTTVDGKTVCKKCRPDLFKK